MLHLLSILLGLWIAWIFVIGPAFSALDWFLKGAHEDGFKRWCATRNDRKPEVKLAPFRIILNPGQSFDANTRV